MNIANILQQQAMQRPNAIAIIDSYRGQERRCQFSELEQASAQAAHLLQQSGLETGDTILVFQPVSMELYVALIALFRLGLVAMFIDPSVGRQHIAHCCQLSPPKALIASTKAHLLRLLSPVLRRIPIKYVIGCSVPGSINWRKANRLTPLSTIVHREPKDPALITFTSGSTGQPKGAVRSHGFLIAQHQALEQSLSLQAGEIDLSTLPIFILANLASGVTSLIPDTDLRRPAAIDAASVMQQIIKIKPERCAASPAFYECLINDCTTNKQPLARFRQIYTGGAPVFPKLLAQLQQLAPQAQIVAVYGSTEAEPIAHIRFSEMTEDDLQAMVDGKGLLTGQPVPPISLNIIPIQWGQALGPFTTNEFNNITLARGQIGEIVVHGDHVLHGYLHEKGNAETKFDVTNQRWHRTGDAGYLDETGRLWLLGRCTARIEDRHGVLYPLTVECAAYQQTGVHRAAIIAHHNKRLLVIEAQKNIEPDRERLGKILQWAKLDEIRLMKKIPMDKRHNAKVDYPALQLALNRTMKKRG